MTNALKVCGIYPFQNSFCFQLHKHLYTFSLLILSIGLFVEAIFFTEGNAKLLPFTYGLCSLHALNKRITLLYYEKELKRFLRELDEPYIYTDHEAMKDVRISKQTLLLIYRIVTSMLIQLFFAALISPFFKIVMGGTLDYGMVMYPIYKPWKVKTFLQYMITYVIQALIVSPALFGIYTTTMYIVFSMIEFKVEYDRMFEALRTLESRTCNTLGMTLKMKNKYYVTTYKNYLRECFIHYQRLVRAFKAFSTWYNLFFTVELIESTTAICLLFFCTLKMNDLSIFLNILSISVHVVLSLLFRCYTGEFFVQMNDELKRCIYEISWYEQPPAIKKFLALFYMHINKPLMLYGFNHFPASYKTFGGVTRISYSYCNFLIASLKRRARRKKERASTLLSSKS